MLFSLFGEYVKRTYDLDFFMHLLKFHLNNTQKLFTKL